MAKVKICGLFKEADIDYVNEAQVDYLGFVFAPSKRQVDYDQAKKLAQKANENILKVGVFVNDSIDFITRLVNDGIIDLVQLHGDEDDSYIEKLKSKVDCPLIKAIKVDNNTDFEKISYDVDYYLLDNKVAGSGESFDWSLIRKLDKPYFLAGGLNYANIDEALKIANYAVDISSGVEVDGIKDRNKIATIVRRIRMSKGRFGIHGGQYIPETLMDELYKIEEAYEFYKNDASFNEELKKLLDEYASRPSLLYYAKKMSEELQGPKIYLKREDLNHTGSHKINNVLGQVLLAKKMGKTRVIAETGAGQHGVATATAAALLDMECEIYMGKEDTDRQVLNVYRMELLGAKVIPVTSGTMTLKDAVNETLRVWTGRVDDTFYVLGSVMGPHPYPTMVRDFQAVISKEARQQILEVEGKLPTAVYACVGGGSNAMGMFYNFIEDEGVGLIGCEAAGKGVDTPYTAATISTGTLGVFHGMKSYFCQDEFGQIAPVYSISAGLDYPGIGPEHANLKDTNRAQYLPITDDEAVEAFEYLARCEGIICAIESAHAIAQVIKDAKKYNKDDIIICCLSGRGDKDVAAIARYKGVEIYE